MRNGFRKMLLPVMLGISVMAFGGCEAAEEFRSVAGSSIQTGVNAIADGLIDGLFAVIEPDAAG